MPPLNDRPGPFDTDHLQSDLRGLAVRGAAVTVVAEGFKILLSLASVMILARLLTPADFGLVAMVAVVTELFSSVGSLGLSVATVQRTEVNHRQVSALFWINVALGAVLFLVGIALAPALAIFYGEPRAAGVTFALSAVLLLRGATVQHQALMRRQMRFGMLGCIQIGSMATALAVAVTMAAGGAGYWALVAQHIVAAAVAATALWVVTGWRPGPPARGAEISGMISLGTHLTGFKLIQYLGGNLDRVVLGRVAGPAELGFYGRASSLLRRPIQWSNNPIARVAIATLSRLQHDPDRYRIYYRKGILGTAAMSLPLMAFVFVDVELVVHVLLGQQWLDVIPILRVLTVAMLSRAFLQTTGWIYLSLGTTDRQLRWGILEAVVTAGSFVIGAPWGAMGVATAYSVSAAVLRIPSMLYCFHRSPLKLRDVGAVVWRPFVAAVTAAAAIQALAPTYSAGLPAVVNLVFDLCAYAGFYALVWLLLPGGRRIAVEALDLAKELRGETLIKRSGANVTE